MKHALKHPRVGTRRSLRLAAVQRPTLPILPPEIIQTIIRESVAPPTSYAAVASRYPTLLAFSLVCRAWRVFAQAELFAHVLLKKYPGAWWFYVACSGPAGELLASKTVGLRLGWEGVTLDPTESHTLCLPLMAGQLSRLREAWLTGMGPITLTFFRGCLGASHSRAFSPICS